MFQGYHHTAVGARRFAALLLGLAACGGPHDAAPTPDTAQQTATDADTVGGMDAPLDTATSTDGTAAPDASATDAGHDDALDTTEDVGPGPDAAWCDNPLLPTEAELCASGICINEACPATAPGLQGCATSAGCVLGSCPKSEVCVYPETGAFALLNTPDPETDTACMPLDVCEPATLSGGLPCIRDWECQSGHCIGIDCSFVPNGFAFGAFRVCASTTCEGLSGRLIPCPEGTVQYISPEDHCFCVPSDACDLAPGAP